MNPSVRAFFIVIAFAVLGFIIDLMLQLAYESQYLVNLAVKDTQMLIALQIVTIILSIMIGIIVAALST